MFSSSNISGNKRPLTIIESNLNFKAKKTENAGFATKGIYGLSETSVRCLNNNYNNHFFLKVPEEQSRNFQFTEAENKSANLLGEAYNLNIRPIIDVIDNLRRFGLQQDIDLPKVVVVGDQSSGKSSIIEAISGVQLPRGKGIITRCPLELQLKRVFDKPWKATLSYKILNGVLKKIDIDKSNEVEVKVSKAQEEMCNNSKGVSKELITLRIESPATTAPDLTLIDLPGIARIAVEGQPKDICNQIKQIILEHVQNQNTVILCVVSANLDAAVNESINIAKSVDPEGIRTLGVITKPDLADESTKDDVLCLLNNEKIPLVKGYHMLKCRSQKELEVRLSLNMSIDNENTFFENDKYYKTANKSQLGTFNLATRITEELVGVIKTNLPSLKEKINISLRESEKNLRFLPKGVPESKNERLAYLIELMSNMNKEIIETLHEGKNKSSEDNLFYQWRKAFEKMRTSFDNIKSNAMKSTFTVGKLKDEIMRKRGKEISGFLNFELFRTLVTNHIMQYKGTAESLVREMRDITDTSLKNIIQENFKHLPSIEIDLKQIYFQELDKMYEKLLKRIETIFEEEKLVFTLDQSFEKEMKLLKEEQAKPQPVFSFGSHSKISGNMENDILITNTERLISIIDCYLKIVHSRLSDVIPMATRQCIHIELGQILNDSFIRYTTSSEIDGKITENKRLNEGRQKLKDKIKRLQMARNELSKI